MDVWVALLLIGLAVVAGGLLLRRVPGGLLAFLGVLVVFGFGIPAIVIDDNQKSDASGGETSAGADTGAEAEGGGSGRDEAAGEEAAGGGSDQASGGGASASAEGKQIFTQSCGTCHTLGDAGTNGNVGPNLDQIKPDKARTATAIENGGSGSGAMPANIVTGEEAEAVAEYVGSVAGG